MTPRKPVDPDAITLGQAVELLGLKEGVVVRMHREGLLRKLEGYPSYSLADVHAFLADPWLNGRQAADVLGVSRSRLSQLADQEKIPVHHTRSGSRVYRKSQLEVVERARHARAAGRELPAGDRAGIVGTRVAGHSSSVSSGVSWD